MTPTTCSVTACETPRWAGLTAPDLDGHALRLAFCQAHAGLVGSKHFTWIAHLKHEFRERIYRGPTANLNP